MSKLFRRLASAASVEALEHRQLLSVTPFRLLPTRPATVPSGPITSLVGPTLPTRPTLPTLPGTPATRRPGSRRRRGT
jgi:hypothetical protein